MKAMDMMMLAGIAVVGAAAAVLLGQYKPEYAFGISLAVGIVILAAVAENVLPLVERIGGLLDTAGMEKDYVAILIKSLGICFITQIAGDACRDCGQSAIAAKVEIGGKAAMLLLSLPLFERLISLAAQLIQS